MGYREERRVLGDKTLGELFGAVPNMRSTALLNSKRDFVSSEIWTRPGLSRRDRWLTALTCVGYAANAAENDKYVHGALQSKALTMAEMREFVLHFAVYCGWSSAELLDESVSRAADALGLAEPEEPPPVSLEPVERQARAADCWASVMTFPPPQPDTPYTSAGILNFVFSEMWDRPGLDRKGRRIVTMASVGMCDSPMPIVSHVYASMNSGQISLEEMQEFVLQFAVYAGWPKASHMQGVTGKVAKCLAEGRPFSELLP